MIRCRNGCICWGLSELALRNKAFASRKLASGTDQQHAPDPRRSFMPNDFSCRLAMSCCQFYLSIVYVFALLGFSFLYFLELVPELRGQAMSVQHIPQHNCYHKSERSLYSTHWSCSSILLYSCLCATCHSGVFSPFSRCRARYQWSMLCLDRI